MHPVVSHFPPSLCVTGRSSPPLAVRLPPPRPSASIKGSYTPAATYHSSSRPQILSSKLGVPVADLKQARWVQRQEGGEGRERLHRQGRFRPGHGGGEVVEQPVHELPELHCGDGHGAAHRLRGADGGPPRLLPLVQLAAPPPGHPHCLRGRLGGRRRRGVIATRPSIRRIHILCLSELVTVRWDRKK
jgi:hypothetical protein